MDLFISEVSWNRRLCLGIKNKYWKLFFKILFDSKSVFENFKYF